MPSANRIVRHFMPFLTTVVVAASVQARPLLGEPGGVALTPVGEGDWAPDRAVTALLDDTGFVWSIASGGRDLRCFRNGDGLSDAWFLEGDHEHSTVGGYTAARAADGDGIQILYGNGNLPGSMPYRLERLRCGQPVELLAEWPAEAVPSTQALGEPELPYAFGPRGAVRADGTFCATAPNGVWCFAPGSPPRAWAALGQEDFEAELLPAVDPARDLPGFSAEYRLKSTTVTHLAFASDGRLVGRAVAEWITGPPGNPGPGAAVLWIVSLDDAGEVRVLYGPETVAPAERIASNLSSVAGYQGFVGTNLRKRLPNLTGLEIDDARGLVWLWPMMGHRLLTRGEDAATFHGIGLGAVRLDGATPDRAGHVELGRRINEVGPQNPEGLPPGFWILTRQLGTPALLLAKRDASQTLSAYTIDIDDSAADLDEDGLDGAEEAALGTSDLNADSDGGGLGDNLEARLFHTDPLAAGDDEQAMTGRHGDGDRHLGLTTLPRLQPGVSALEDLDDQPWASGWLCGRGRCASSEGRMVDLSESLTAAPTRDGRAAVGMDLAGDFARWGLPEGTKEVLASGADLSPVLGNMGDGAVVPGRDGEVFVIGDSGVVRLSPDSVLYDARQALCDAEWGSCYSGPEPLISDLFQTGAGATYPIGYDAVLNRVIVGQVAGGERWVLSVGADGPIVLARGADLDGVIYDDWSGRFPTAALAPMKALSLPEGDFFVTYALAGLPWTLPPSGVGLADGRLAPYATLDFPVPVGLRALGLNGGVYGRGAVSDEDMYPGLFALVPMGGPLAPGDAVLLGAPVSSTAEQPLRQRLGRLGRAGAYEEPWGSPTLPRRPDPLAEAGTIRGVGASASTNQLCLAGEDGRLWLLPWGAAAAELVFGVDGAADCLFRPDGGLSVLLAQPGAILEFAPGETAARDARRLETGSALRPVRFARDEGGTYYVIDELGPMGCVTPEGPAPSPHSLAAVAVGDDGDVYALERPTGRLLELERPCAGGAATPLTSPDGQEYSAEWIARTLARALPRPWLLGHLVLRPDGLIFLGPARERFGPGAGTVLDSTEPGAVYALEPSTGRVIPAVDDIGLADGPAALAFIPGATWTDAYGPETRADAGVSASDGDAGGAVNGHAADEGGCGCRTSGRSPGPVGWIGVGVVALSWGRRRSRRPATTSNASRPRSRDRTGLPRPRGASAGSRRGASLRRGGDAIR
ncbi:MYXO-CTERM sorting domain-containing protein [Myxococcota bacterium]|nr:MYXO-CTERM sorting domain-containing protein [Myxococcota bacterium]